MYLSVIDVQPTINFELILTFANSEKRLFDMKPYLSTGIFRELENKVVFNTVRVSFDTIEWDNGADFDPEILYRDSSPIDISVASAPGDLYGANKSN